MSEELEYIAYEGEAFTVEWYFSANGKSQALEFYRSLTVDERIGVLKLFKRMGDHGEIKDKSKFRFEGDKLFAFKPQPDRFLCFFYDGQKVIVTNAFRKKQQKLPVREKAKALKSRVDYVNRVAGGNYYE